MENLETPVRILVVDDEPDIRNILHILLSSRGYEVDEAENGLRAVELVRAQPDYDLIILDIMMPGMDGVSACADSSCNASCPAASAARAVWFIRRNIMRFDPRRVAKMRSDQVYSAIYAQDRRHWPQDIARIVRRRANL